MAVLNINEDLLAELEILSKKENVSLLATLEKIILTYGTLEAAADELPSEHLESLDYCASRAGYSRGTAIIEAVKLFCNSTH